MLHLSRDATAGATTLSFATFASAHTDNVKVLHLTAVTVEEGVVDVDPTGDEPRPATPTCSARTCSATATRSASAVGSAPSSATPTPPGAVQCVITARIGGDQLTVQGLAFDQPRSVFAITGGTGRWRNAGGQVVIRNVSATEYRLTLFISDLG